MIRFLSSESAPQLDKLRKRLERNTRNLMELFRERATIAKEIGQFKEENSIPIRIRQRERELLESFPDLDDMSRSIISSLFEFTIVNESSSIKGNDALSGKSLVLSGETGQLQLLAGLFISAPGVEVYSPVPLPDSIKTGIQAKGGHIVVGDLDLPDLVVGLDSRETCGIMIDSSGIMRIELDGLKSQKPKRILVKQR